jgi:hypothetical protein
VNNGQSNFNHNRNQACHENIEYNEKINLKGFHDTHSARVAQPAPTNKLRYRHFHQIHSSAPSQEIELHKLMTLNKGIHHATSIKRIAPSQTGSNRNRHITPPRNRVRSDHARAWATELETRTEHRHTMFCMRLEISRVRSAVDPPAPHVMSQKDGPCATMRSIRSNRFSTPSSVLGGKNSNENTVRPSAAASWIFSITFISNLPEASPPSASERARSNGEQEGKGEGATVSGCGCGI